MATSSYQPWYARSSHKACQHKGNLELMFLCEMLAKIIIIFVATLYKFYTIMLIITEASEVAIIQT